jgi:hypothetical protein
MFVVFFLIANIAFLQKSVDGGGAGQAIQNAWVSVVNAFNNAINSIVDSFKKLINDTNKLLDQVNTKLEEALRKGNLMDFIQKLDFCISSF